MVQLSRLTLFLLSTTTHLYAKQAITLPPTPTLTLTEMSLPLVPAPGLLNKLPNSPPSVAARTFSSLNPVGHLPETRTALPLHQSQINRLPSAASCPPWEINVCFSVHLMIPGRLLDLTALNSIGYLSTTNRD